VAYEGTVYDVSGSFVWQKGRHQVLHRVGVEYGGELEGAPHGADLFARLPVVWLLWVWQTLRVSKTRRV
jgi:predicted heme/steroid binding protein